MADSKYSQGLSKPFTLSLILIILFAASAGNSIGADARDCSFLRLNVNSQSSEQVINSGGNVNKTAFQPGSKASTRMIPDYSARMSIPETERNRTLLAILNPQKSANYGHFPRTRSMLNFSDRVESDSKEKPYSKVLLPLAIALIAGGLTYTLYVARSS